MERQFKFSLRNASFNIQKEMWINEYAVIIVFIYSIMHGNFTFKVFIIKVSPQTTSTVLKLQSVAYLIGCNCAVKM